MAVGLCVGIPLLVQTPNKKDLAAASGSWEDYAASSYAIGSTPETLYIETPEQLAKFRVDMENHIPTGRQTYILTKDIDMSAHNWFGVSGFGLYATQGTTFDGQGHTISGLTGTRYFLYKFSEFIVRNITFLNCTTSLCDEPADWVCENINFKNCDVKSGLFGDELTCISFDCNNCTIDSCSITGSGDIGAVISVGYACFPTIKNLKVIGNTTITSNGGNTGGLIGLFQMGVDTYAGHGTIKNVTIDDTVKISTSGEGHVGGLVGYVDIEDYGDGSFVNISNCTIGGKCEISSYVSFAAGIIGFVDCINAEIDHTISISNCTIGSGVTIEVAHEGYPVGGIYYDASASGICNVGKNASATINDCVVEKGAKISSDIPAGICDGSSSTTISRCFNGANMLSGMQAWGIAKGGTVKNCVNISDLVYNPYAIGGDKNEKNINFGELKCTDSETSLIGLDNNGVNFGAITRYGSLSFQDNAVKYYGGHAKYNEEVQGTYVENLLELASDRSWWKDPDVWGEDVWTDDELWWWDYLDWSDWGDDSMFAEDKEVYEISNAYELGGLARVTNGLSTIDKTTLDNKTFKQTANIDLVGFTWIPMDFHNNSDDEEKSFTYDGQGFSISNLYGENGLIGSDDGVTYLYNLTLKNMTIESGLIDGSGDVGALIGSFTNYCMITIDNCANYATVRSTGASAGGIVGSAGGYESGYSITNCVNYGSVISNGSAGGIIGQSLAYEDGGSYKQYTFGCVNRGTIQGNYASGIVGCTGSSGGFTWENPNISNCINYGDILGKYVAGIMYASFNGDTGHGYSIDNCAVFGHLINTGEASQSHTISVFVPYCEMGYMWYELDVHLSNCYANVSVSAYNALDPKFNYFCAANVGVSNPDAGVYEYGEPQMQATNSYVVVNGKGYYTEDFTSTDFVVANKINDNLPFISSHFWSGQFGTTIDKTWFEEQGYKAVGK